MAYNPTRNNTFYGKGIEKGWKGKIGIIPQSYLDKYMEDPIFKNEFGKSTSPIDIQKYLNDYFKTGRTGIDSQYEKEPSNFGYFVPEDENFSVDDLSNYKREQQQIAEDNKWGEQSDRALRTYLASRKAQLGLNKNGDYSRLSNFDESDYGGSLHTKGNENNDSFLGILISNKQINPSPSVPYLNRDAANINLSRIPNPTYSLNRKQTRDIIRNAGFNPYNYSGAQRKALRKYLNGESSDTSLLQGDLASFIRQPQLNKFGGKMNKFQDGGAMQADPQQQIMALVQAAMQGDQEAQSTIQQIQQAAQQGDQQASQMLQMIQGIMQQMQGQAQMAKRGAKLNYINRLKGNCPEGYQMNYFKIGGKVCRQCQEIKTSKASCSKKMVKKGCSGMVKGIRAEMGAKLESMKKGGSTAFGDRSHTPASTNAQGRFGGRKAFNEYGTHKHPKVTRNVFSAFGDEGKKKPTNVGLVGHHATGNTGLMRTKETAKNNKHTAFGAAVARFHKGAKPTSKGGITTIKGAPKGKSHDGGLKKVTKNAFGGSLNGVPFIKMGD